MASWQMGTEEWIVIGVVIGVLFLFEAGPKLLNFMKKRREGRQDLKN